MSPIAKELLHRFLLRIAITTWNLYCYIRWFLQTANVVESIHN